MDSYACVSENFWLHNTFLQAWYPFEFNALAFSIHSPTQERKSGFPQGISGAFDGGIDWEDHFGTRYENLRGLLGQRNHNRFYETRQLLSMCATQSNSLDQL